MKHSLANYPKQFAGYVVSPTKICVQFKEVQSKLRYMEGASYVKLPSTAKAIAIEPTGTEVDILAVGCQLPILEELQLKLIEAYLEYGTTHSTTYSETYEKEFIDFISQVKKGIDHVYYQLKCKGGSDEK